MSHPTMHTPIVDALGQAIIDGNMAVGSAINLADIEREYSVSRTVAREAMRQLQSLGLIQARRRVGLRVTDQRNWQVLNPKIIEWRLNGPSRDRQINSLTELRIAVEPTAGRLAAQHATESEIQSLVELADKLQDMGGRGLGQHPEYLMTDVAWHVTLLRASHNEMLAALEGSVEAVMVGRTRLGLSPDYPVPEVLRHHQTAAMAIKHRMAEAAEVYCRQLVNRVWMEFAPLHQSLTEDIGDVTV